MFVEIKFKFPSSEKDSERYNEWVRQVKRTRDKWSGPTKNSRLCSSHFTDDQFDPIPKLKMSLGMNVHYPRLLKSTAIPMIFKCPEAKASTSRKTKESTVQKLHRKRTVASLLQDQPTHLISDTGAGAEAISMEPFESLSPCICDSATQTDYILKQSRASQILPQTKNGETQTLLSCFTKCDTGTQVEWDASLHTDIATETFAESSEEPDEDTDDDTDYFPGSDYSSEDEIDTQHSVLENPNIEMHRGQIHKFFGKCYLFSSAGFIVKVVVQVTLVIRQRG